MEVKMYAKQMMGPANDNNTDKVGGKPVLF